MKFKVLNKKTIKEYTEDTPHIVISITTSREHATLPKNDNRKGLLQLFFDDLDYGWLDNPVYGKVMDKGQAKEIWDFVTKHTENSEDEVKVNLIICQCDAGVSRSSATAAALSKLLNGTDDYYFNHPLYIPNRHVYRQILDYVWSTDKNYFPEVRGEGEDE